MRSILSAVIVALGLAAAAPAQTCTGLCLQQVSCPSGGPTTTLSGVVYAPNGTDPLPNVTVYVPNAAVAPFTQGVSCPVPGTPPSGSPLVGATTAVDGSFTIPDMPVGTNIPLVIVSGRWRRQLVIPTVTACTANTVPTGFASFPSNQSEGDIPRIAIATGSVDSVECVLRKIGISDGEFTDPGGNVNGYTGRVNLFVGDNGSGNTSIGGAKADTATPNESALMGDTTNATLLGYDLLMLPCEGSPDARPTQQLQNIVAFANAGGRVYSTHYSYEWLYQNSPFNTTANWDVGQGLTGAQEAAPPSTLPATVNVNFSGGLELSQWLALSSIAASTVPGQIPISEIRHDMNGVIAPTQAWLNLNMQLNADPSPVMQMVFDTPVGSTGTQCGRVLFNEYHVENNSGTNGVTFPGECPPVDTALTPQEKLLEYSLFELTNDGGAFTLSPTTQAFGTQPVGFNSPAQTFTWTNNSTFAASVTLLSGSGDFSVAGSNCASVAGGASCQINVVFNPSAIGARTGTLTVGSNGSTLIATLTGTGIPDLTIPTANLAYGSVDVGASATQSIVVTNAASGSVPVPPFVTTGPYTTSNNCGSALAAGASCTLNVIFTPNATGPLPGTVNVQSATAGAPATMTGNGIDFTIVASPTSGTVVAGIPTSTSVTTMPLAGFSNNLSLSCSTSAPGSTCKLSQTSVSGASAAVTTVSITTTSQYAVVGYGGFAGRWLALIALAAGCLLWMRRRSAAPLTRSALTMLLLALLCAAGSVGLTGCSGKLPAENANYTAPGTYNFSISATDGFLVHAVDYSLKVTAN